MQIVLEIIGALVVLLIFALGVEKYIEFLKSRTAATPAAQPPTEQSKSGDTNA